MTFLHRYQCRHCGVLLRPLPGDCCVFCSYGTVKCPPIQEHGCCRTW
nr:GDCCVxC domain-containing (seleno)protein [Aeromonas salmonicida]